MEKKKLIINAVVCDARNVSETTLDSHREIIVNAARIKEDIQKLFYRERGR